MPALENVNRQRALAIVEGSGNIIRSRGFIEADAASIRVGPGRYRMVLDFLGIQGKYDAPISRTSPGQLVPFVSCSGTGVGPSMLIANVREINGTQAPFVPAYFDVRVYDGAGAPADPDFWYLTVFAFE